jgi:hypothetical protein
VSQTVNLRYGASYQLSISQQAAGFKNREVFSTQPVVRVLDVSGRLVENFTGQVAVSMSNGTLEGTKSVAASGGIATFTDLYKYGLVGTTKVLTFSASLGSPATTKTVQQAAFTLTHGTATQLAITTEASGAVNDVAFTGKPVVEIQDQDGNRVTTGDDSTQIVTFDVTGPTIGGTATKAAVAGVADFTNNGLKLTGTAGSYTVAYSITSPSIIQKTQSLTLAVGAATKLALVTEAAGFVNRTDFTTQPEVEVQDISGNKVNSTAQITASISSGALTGIAQLNASAGTATFVGLGKTGLVGSKTLTFSATDLASATQDFTLTYGAATKVRATTPAAGFTNDVAFSTQPVIKIQDADGNTVENSTATVTITSSGASLE